MFVDFLVLGIMIALIVCLVMVPIWIAKSRDVNAKVLKTIKILSWLGIIFGITWLIALVWAFIADKEGEVAAPAETEERRDLLESIEKLGQLREQGVITESDFLAKKDELLKKL